MKLQKSTSRKSQRFILFALGLVVVAYLICTSVTKRTREVEAAAKERIAHQIANIKAGISKEITLGNEIELGDMLEFVKVQDQLDATDDYEVKIMYSHDLDDFLRQISGLRGAKSLVLYKTDVTDTGLESVALMPDLARISITPTARRRLTDDAMAKLRHKLPNCSITMHPNE